MYLYPRFAPTRNKAYAGSFFCSYCDKNCCIMAARRKIIPASPPALCTHYRHDPANPQNKNHLHHWSCL